MNELNRISIEVVSGYCGIAVPAAMCLLAWITNEKSRIGSLLTYRRSQLQKEIPDVYQVIVENLTGIVEHSKNSRILNRVKNALSFLSSHNDAAFAQHRQLLRERCLLNGQSLTKISNADFAVAKSVQNLDSQRMTERFEKLSSELG